MIIKLKFVAPWTMTLSLLMFTLLYCRGIVSIQREKICCCCGQMMMFICSLSGMLLHIHLAGRWFILDLLVFYRLDLVWSGFICLYIYLSIVFILLSIPFHLPILFHSSIQPSFISHLSFYPSIPFHSTHNSHFIYLPSICSISSIHLHFTFLSCIHPSVPSHYIHLSIQPTLLICQGIH